MQYKNYYMLEFAFSRETEKILKRLSRKVSRVIGRKRSCWAVNRMPIGGPFHTDDESRLDELATSVARRHRVSFRLDGFGKYGAGIVYGNAVPSPGFWNARRSLRRSMAKFCRFGGKWYGEYHPYCIFNVKYDDGRFDDAVSFLDGWGREAAGMEPFGLDIVVLKNGSPWRRKRVRREGVGEPKVGRLVLDGRAFAASDAHFGHENVIRYSHRPFKSVEEMNHTMLSRWNDSVRTSDDVVFLGDMTEGNLMWAKRRNVEEAWLRRLTGKIHFMRGNHDNGIIRAADVIGNPHVLEYNEMEFLLTHIPYRPPWWDGWIMHGHLHNGDLRRYPRINYLDRTINVGMDISGYAPTDLGEIVAKIQGT